MPQKTNKKLEQASTLDGVRIIWRYLLIYKKQTITLSLIGLVSAAGNAFVPYLAGNFFDSILTPDRAVDLLGFTLPFFLAALILWFVIQLATYLIDWRFNILRERLSHDVWGQYIAHGFSYLLELPMSFHKKEKIGSICNTINRAGNSIETIIGKIITTLTPQFLSIAISLVIVIKIMPVLGLVLLGAVSLYCFVLWKNVSPLAAIQTKYNEAISDVFGDMYDATANTLAIKQATTEKYEKTKFFTKFGDTIGLYLKMSKIWTNLNFLQKAIILVTQVIIFLLSVAFIRNGMMTIGELLAFNAYAVLMFNPFIVLGRNWQTIQNGIVQLNHSEKTLSLPTEIYSPKKAIAKGEIVGDITFENVDYYYTEDRPVLQNISFSVKAGEVIALVGESGVGKSTLIDLISGYHFANKGKVLIDGEDIKKYNLHYLRSHIAVVPQEVVLFNDTIFNNLKYGNFEATKEAIDEAARKAHSIDFINKLPQKWEQIVGERGVKLSVGQKQRVAIARAILRDPRILILDEPTSALDAGSESIITKSLEELMSGKTTFIIAHRLSTVRKADKILVFKDGRIIETGKHDELLLIDGGEYRRLYELQIGLHN